MHIWHILSMNFMFNVFDMVSTSISIKWLDVSCIEFPVAEACGIHTWSHPCNSASSAPGHKGQLQSRMFAWEYQDPEQIYTTWTYLNLLLIRVTSLVGSPLLSKKRSCFKEYVLDFSTGLVGGLYSMIILHKEEYPKWETSQLKWCISMYFACWETPSMEMPDMLLWWIDGLLTVSYQSTDLVILGQEFLRHRSSWPGTKWGVSKGGGAKGGSPKRLVSNSVWGNWPLN